MDDDFRILFDYVEQMKRELQDKAALQDKADLQTKLAEDKEKKCVHESIETEEAYVCCKCGLVLEDIFQPDIHWCDHVLMPQIYGGADRLNAMHKVWTRSLVAVEPRRPPMTDVGTETAFRLDQRKHFRKSKHLLRSEVN